jgi:dienelactone hydrolase
MTSYVVYDSSFEGKRPAIMVVHEWWGLNDYPKSRARQLAELGYIAMAVDMYGNGRMGNDPESASALATPFYQDPQMAKKHFEAGFEKLKSFPQADNTKTAGIGYCFGGGVLLNLARLGENLNGVVSFHGSLLGTPANKDLLKSEILVCHGGDDPFVPQAEVDQFKKQMDSIGAKYQFVAYPGATHAFTNPAATEAGKRFNIPVSYNAAADTASWNEMKAFFNRLFK